MTLQDALTFASVVLIASIPFAVQLMTTRTLTMASRLLARNGAIVARSAALEESAGALWFEVKKLQGREISLE